MAATGGAIYSFFVYFKPVFLMYLFMDLPQE